MNSLKWAWIFFQLVNIHKGYINVVNNINSKLILSIPKKKLILNVSSHRHLLTNWNFDIKKSNFNHKYVDKRNVKSEQIKEIFRISIDALSGTNSKQNEPNNGKMIKLNSIKKKW